MADQLRLAVLGMTHDPLWGKLEELMARKETERVGAVGLTRRSASVVANAAAAARRIFDGIRARLSRR